MKQLSISRKWSTVMAIMFTLPAFYFLSASILKFEFGVPAVYDAGEPLMLMLGLNENLGFNINLIIVFGPIIALGLTLLQMMQVKVRSGAQGFYISVLLRKRPEAISLLVASGMLAGLLLMYAVVENCNC